MLFISDISPFWAYGGKEKEKKMLFWSCKFLFELIYKNPSQGFFVVSNDFC